MWTGRGFLTALGLASALALGGCAYDDGYYGGMSVGTGYYGGGWYDDYGPAGYYGPGLYSGWYDGFYYPGSGYYVYNRSGQRYRWNDGQRRYWEGRREARRGEGPGNWNNGVPRSSWRERANAGTSVQGGPNQGRWNGDRNGRWNGDQGAMPGAPSPQPGRGQDMTTPRPGWTPGATAPRARSESATRSDGPRSRRDGWRGQRD